MRSQPYNGTSVEELNILKIHLHPLIDEFLVLHGVIFSKVRFNSQYIASTVKLVALRQKPGRSDIDGQN